MNITASVVSGRDLSLLGGDYDAYHAQTTRKLHNLRRRLGVTNRGRKYNPRGPVTVENVAQNIEWVQLLLASSERAWSSAMAMKAAQSAENTQRSMPGSTKRQIASRLRRAIIYADNLVSVLRAHGGPPDTLEARAYLSMLKGSREFEKGRWQQCIQHHSVAQVVYTALAQSSRTDVYKDLLSGIVEPSLRYAAYQLKMPRTKAISEIAVENFPSSDASLRKEVEAIHPEALALGNGATPNAESPKEVPSTISWRSRQVKLEDANISLALGVSKEREDSLRETYKTFQDGSIGPKEFATAYEEVITARQDAADATKVAIEELAAEGVDPGDSRIQSLQITRTAVNYAVIEWRVGRNRVLCGAQDGLIFDAVAPKHLLKPRKDGKNRAIKDESSGRKLSRLRERAALYDLILQSLDAVKELPGVVADTSFVDELEAKHAYFRSLKCLAIGRSHAIMGHIIDALALYARALDLAEEASTKLDPTFQNSTTDLSAPPRLELSSNDLQRTTSMLSKLVKQYRGLAELKAYSEGSNKSTVSEGGNQGVKSAPLIERLGRNEYIPDIDLTNLVNYPPTLRPVPVKPLFFDLAWNYIVYPGQDHNGTRDDAANGKMDVDQEAQTAPTAVEEEKKPAKRGWFGFGR